MIRRLTICTFRKWREKQSGAIVLHICETNDVLVPADPAARIRAVQWLIPALNSVEPRVMQAAVVNVFEANHLAAFKNTPLAEWHRSGEHR